jgi:hypothetical protein
LVICRTEATDGKTTSMSALDHDVAADFDFDSRVKATIVRKPLAIAGAGISNRLGVLAIVARRQIGRKFLQWYGCELPPLQYIIGRAPELLCLHIKIQQVPRASSLHFG